jgi:hypothetical protein
MPHFANHVKPAVAKRQRRVANFSPREESSREGGKQGKVIPHREGEKGKGRIPATTSAAYLDRKESKHSE